MDDLPTIQTNVLEISDKPSGNLYFKHETKAKRQRPRSLAQADGSFDSDAFNLLASIKGSIKAIGSTQDEVANSIGKTAGWLSYKLSGGRKMLLEDLVEIAEATGMELSIGFKPIIERDTDCGGQNCGNCKC